LAGLPKSGLGHEIRSEAEWLAATCVAGAIALNAAWGQDYPQGGIASLDDVENVPNGCAGERRDQAYALGISEAVDVFVPAQRDPPPLSRCLSFSNAAWRAPRPCRSTAVTRNWYWPRGS